MSKIIILNGGFSNTDNISVVIKSFVKGARSAGHTVSEFLLGDMDIHNCTCCFECKKNKNKLCRQKDDMDKIYPIYTDADIVVLATPLYYWTINRPLKHTVDRLFAVKKHGTKQNECKKKSIFIAISEDFGFDKSMHWYECIKQYMEWQNSGTVFHGGIQGIDDLKKSGLLDKAYQLGSLI